MNFKDAVRTAKQHVEELFSDEKLSSLGLEEIEHDDAGKVCTVTVGFSRPWDQMDLRSVFSAERDTKVGELCKELGVTRQTLASSAPRANCDPTARNSSKAKPTTSTNAARLIGLWIVPCQRQ